MEKGKEYEKDEIPGWLKNDLFKFIYEELADTANYALLQFLKLRMVEEALHASGIDLSFLFDGESTEHGVPLGPGAFTSSGDVSQLLQPNKRPEDLGQRGS